MVICCAISKLLIRLQGCPPPMVHKTVERFDWDAACSQIVTAAARGGDKLLIHQMRLTQGRKPSSTGPVNIASYVNYSNLMAYDPST
jgi:hypothetical protein